MMSDPRRQFELAEDVMLRDLNDGFLTLAEYNAEMRELQRDYQAMAEEAAWDAYESERECW